MRALSDVTLGRVGTREWRDSDIDALSQQPEMALRIIAHKIQKSASDKEFILGEP